LASTYRLLAAVVRPLSRSTSHKIAAATRPDALREREQPRSPHDNQSPFSRLYPIAAHRDDT
jgi:hypothetical protein